MGAKNHQSHRTYLLASSDQYFCFGFLTGTDSILLHPPHVCLEPARLLEFLNVNILPAPTTGSYVYKKHPLSPGTLRRQLKSSGKRKFQGGVGIFWQKTGSVLELSCCRSVPRLGGYHSLW